MLNVVEVRLYNMRYCDTAMQHQHMDSFPDEILLFMIMLHCSGIH